MIVVIIVVVEYLNISLMLSMATVEFEVFGVKQQQQQQHNNNIHVSTTNMTTTIITTII